MGTTILYIAGFTAACLVSYFVGETVASRGAGRYWTYVVVGLGFGALERVFELGGASSDASLLTGVSLGVVGLAVGTRLARALEARGEAGRSILIPLGLSTVLAAIGFLTLRGFAALPALALLTSQSRTAAALLVGVALIAPALGEGRPGEAEGAQGWAALMAFIALVHFASATGAASALFAPDPGLASIALGTIVAPVLATGIGAGVALLLVALASDRLPGSVLAPGLLVAVLGITLLLGSSSELPGIEAGIDAALVFAVAAGLAARRRSPRARLEEATASLGPLVYIVFFTFVGSRLQMSAIASVIPLALVYLGLRTAILTLGSRYLDGRTAQDGSSLPALLPHGAVALALVGAVGTRFPMIGDTAVTLAVLTAMMGEAFGPHLSHRLSTTRKGSLRGGG